MANIDFNAQLPAQYFESSQNVYYEQTKDTPAYSGPKSQTSYTTRFPDYVPRPAARVSWIDRNKHSHLIRVLLIIALILFIFCVSLLSFQFIYR
uniref:Uncharacterized protein n=1 Tax=viral metagenome TaxID=1070528 RepID=A0A6C0BER1_9ZZZZ